MEKKFRQGTLCVQAGYKAKNGEPIEVPIIQSTTFKYDDSDEMAKLFDLEKEGYFYTRLQNPTNDAVAAKIATLEGGVGAMQLSAIITGEQLRLVLNNNGRRTGRGEYVTTNFR